MKSAVHLLRLTAFLALASSALSCEYSSKGRRYKGGWECSDGQCIDPKLKCNGGTPDCGDGSDETPWGCDQGGNSMAKEGK